MVQTTLLYQALPAMTDVTSETKQNKSFLLKKKKKQKPFFGHN
jgi:hypothetical protein